MVRKSTGKHKFPLAFYQYVSFKFEP